MPITDFLGVTYKLQPTEYSVPQTERFILRYIIIIIIIMAMKRILCRTLYLIYIFRIIYCIIFL